MLMANNVLLLIPTRARIRAEEMTDTVTSARDAIQMALTPMVASNSGYAANNGDSFGGYHQAAAPTRPVPTKVMFSLNHTQNLFYTSVVLTVVGLE